MTYSPDLIPLDLTTLMVDELPPISEREVSQMSVFLKHDTWTVEEGLCLLCRIDPSASDIEWSVQKNGREHDDGKVTIRSCQPFNEDQPIFALRDRDSVLHDSDGSDTVKQKKLKDAEADLYNLRKIWDSGSHTKTRYTPEYFIDWAISKDHQIGWLEWAIKSVRYVHPKNRAKIQGGKLNNLDSDQLAPKSKTTALKIIGGLLISAYGIDIHGRLANLPAVLGDLAEAGVIIDVDTLRKWAKEAAEIIPKPAKK